MNSPVAVFDKVSKSFGTYNAVNNLSFELIQGESFAILGHNGAGKTTSMRILLGLLRPDTGKVQLMGCDPYPESQEMISIRRRVAVLQEEDRLYLKMTAIENLKFWLGLYGFPAKEHEKRAKNSLQKVGLVNSDTKVGVFSKGMRRRLALARALMLEPQLLILDEPTVGLDPEARVEVRNLLDTLVSESGVTLLITSHDLEEVEKLCQRMVILEHGNSILEGNIEELRKKCKPVLVIELPSSLPGSHLESLKTNLTALPYVDHLVVKGSSLRLGLLDNLNQVPNEILYSLTSFGIKFSGITFEFNSLEDIYLQAIRTNIDESNEE